MQAKSSTAATPLMRILAGVAFMAIVLFMFTDPAGAKGPESVTISGPGIHGSIELMDTASTELIARLMEQTGLWYATGDLPLPIEEPTGEMGFSYTLTWINSGPPDKSADERTIRQAIYLDPEDGPVIHTPAQEGLQGWGPGVIGWFAAPSGLQDTLAELGVPISERSSFREEVLPEVAANEAVPERESASSFWYLGVVGFALVTGLAGMLGTRRRTG